MANVRLYITGLSQNIYTLILLTNKILDKKFPNRNRVLFLNIQMCPYTYSYTYILQMPLYRWHVPTYVWNFVLFYIWFSFLCHTNIVFFCYFNSHYSIEWRKKMGTFKERKIHIFFLNLKFKNLKS